MSGTNDIPRALEDALVKAKDWYDRRVELERSIQVAAGVAQRDQQDRDEIDREAAEYLEEIIEAVVDTWGFAPRLGRTP